MASTADGVNQLVQKAEERGKRAGTPSSFCRHALVLVHGCARRNEACSGYYRLVLVGRGEGRGAHHGMPRAVGGLKLVGSTLEWHISAGTCDGVERGLGQRRRATLGHAMMAYGTLAPTVDRVSQSRHKAEK